MNIAKQYEQKYDDFYIGKTTLIGLPVNDSVYLLIMTDLAVNIKKEITETMKKMRLRIWVSIILNIQVVLWRLIDLNRII